MGRMWPLPKGSYKISSRFGGRPNPFTGRPDYHSGTDFAAPDGTPFYACAGGRVQMIGSATGYGQWIVIDSPDSEGGGCYEYGHMWNAFATGLKVGDQVKAGQKIGYIGSNGQSTGPHLHLTIWERGYGGKRVDPETWLKDASYPGQKTAPKTPSPKPSGKTLFGIDVSEHQNGMNLAAAVKAHNLAFVILRLCDGTYADEAFKSHLADVERSNAIVSTYWYLRAPSEGSTIKQQVDVIDRQFDGRKDISVWIDVESVSRDGSRKLLTKNDVWEAKRELERRGYYVPGVYSGAWYWEHMPGGEPSMEGLGYLWCSNYATNRTGRIDTAYEADGGDSRGGWGYPLGNRKPDILQFSSNGIVNGTYPIDCNAFKGSMDALKKILIPSHKQIKTKENTDMNESLILDAIRKEGEATRRYVREFVSAFNGPIGSDVKDIREQAVGARDSIPGNIQASYPGWDLRKLMMSVEDKDFNNLTTTELLALLLLVEDDDREKIRKYILEE